MLEIIGTFLLKFLLAPLIGLICFLILSSKKNIKRKVDIKKILVFFIISLAIIILPGFLGFLKDEFVWSGLLITVTYYLICGIVFHIYAQKDSAHEIGIGESKRVTITLLVAICIVGGWGYYWLFYSLSDLDYSIWSTTNVLWFLLPYFTMLSLKYYLEIPLPINTPWELSNSTFDRTQWDIQDKSNSILVDIKIQQKIKDEYFTTLTARLPEGISLGNWFSWFVEDQNKKCPQDKIETTMEGYCIGWNFYTPRLGSLELGQRLLDPQKNCTENRIKNKQTIYIYRITK